MSGLQGFQLLSEDRILRKQLEIYFQLSLYSFETYVYNNIFCHFLAWIRQHCLLELTVKIKTSNISSLSVLFSVCNTENHLYSVVKKNCDKNSMKLYNKFSFIHSILLSHQTLYRFHFAKLCRHMHVTFF